MPGWKEVIDDIASRGTVYDVVRREHLRLLADETKRNVIAYYSGWLQKPGADNPDRFGITDADKSGFMAAIHGLDRAKGLDLLVHSPGGDVGATEALGDYLRLMFGKDIRVIVPQLAMSGGSMLACLGKQIVMGKHSSIGPIDPQFGTMPAFEVVKEFDEAYRDLAMGQNVAYWGMLLAKYPAAFVGKCRNALDWSRNVVEIWLKDGMFDGVTDGATKAQDIAKALADHGRMKAHNRHISATQAQSLGLNVDMLEDPTNGSLQEKVLTVHHCYIATLGDTDACKIIENHEGLAFVSDARLMTYRKI